MAGDAERFGPCDVRGDIVDEQRPRRIDPKSLDGEAVIAGSGFISFSVPDTMMP